MKRIGCIVYNRQKDCCMVRYNGDVFYEIPEGAELYVLHGNVWVRSQLRRSIWGYWKLCCSGLSSSITGVCVLIDIDDDGRYIPHIIKSLYGGKKK